MIAPLIVEFKTSWEQDQWDNEVNSLEKKNEVSNQIAGRGDIDLSTTWMSNTIDCEYSSNLSLMSISSYVEYETGNKYTLKIKLKCSWIKETKAEILQFLILR